MDRLERKILFAVVAAPAIVGLALFGPAGTLDYWQAWAYMGILFIPMFFVVAYFLNKDPVFLERRMKTKENDAGQDLIVKAGAVIFLVAFMVPGLDRRFGWSVVPAEISIAADALAFIGYALVFLVFRENSYAGRTVQVEKGQKVIATGPYSILRHPMYLGTLTMYLATPIALGSLVAVPFFLPLIPMIVLRILNEEKILERDLPNTARKRATACCRSSGEDGAGCREETAEACGPVPDCAPRAAGEPLYLTTAYSPTWTSSNSPHSASWRLPS
jgi:protein-S-isoprenylcysteine O-methyltransferase Ste14